MEITCSVRNVTAVNNNFISACCVKGDVLGKMLLSTYSYSQGITGKSLLVKDCEYVIDKLYRFIKVNFG